MPQAASLEELKEEFRTNPSIENYVRLRRSFPDEHIPCVRFAGFRQLLCLKDDLTAGIDAGVIYDAFDGDQHAVDKLSLLILERLVERRLLQAKGKTHLQARKAAISDAIVNYLINMMLEVIYRFELEFPSSLLVLIREQLGGPNPGPYKHYLQREQFEERAEFMATYSQENLPSANRIAKSFSVNRSTTGRWLRDPKFAQRVSQLRRLLGFSKSR